MNPRIVYLLVAIALGTASVSYAVRDSDATDDSSDSSSDSEGEHDIAYHHQKASEDSEDADFSDSEDFSGLDIELVPQAKGIEAFGEANKKYERLFVSRSEPVEPEEALKMLTELQAMYVDAKKEYISGEAKLEIGWRIKAIKNLLALDAISRDCSLNGQDSSWIRIVFDDNKRAQGLEAYLKSRREKLFESCKPLFANNVNRYQEVIVKKDAGRGETVVLKSLLANVPDELVLKEEFLSTKSDQVSAALSEAYNFHYRGKSFRDKNEQHYKKKFVEYFTQVYEQLPMLEIVPNGLLALANRNDIAQVLDRRVIDWLKVQRLCEEIKPKANAAAAIVFAYNESVRAEKRAAKQQCKGIGCFPGLGTKAARSANK